MHSPDCLVTTDFSTAISSQCSPQPGSLTLTFFCCMWTAEISQPLWTFLSSQKQMHYLTLPAKKLDCLVVRPFCIPGLHVYQYICLLVRCKHKKIPVLIFMEDKGTFRHTPVNASQNNRLTQGVPSMAVNIKATYSHVKKYFLMKLSVPRMWTLIFDIISYTEYSFKQKTPNHPHYSFQLILITSSYALTTKIVLKSMYNPSYSSH